MYYWNWKIKCPLLKKNKQTQTAWKLRRSDGRSGREFVTKWNAIRLLQIVSLFSQSIHSKPRDLSLPAWLLHLHFTHWTRKMDSVALLSWKAPQNWRQITVLFTFEWRCQTWQRAQASIAWRGVILIQSTSLHASSLTTDIQKQNLSAKL